MRTHRKHRLKRFCFALLLSVFFAGALFSQPLSFRSQTSAWGSGGSGNMCYGLRFIPELSYSQKLPGQRELSIEAAANAFSVSQLKSLNKHKSHSDISSYRLWARMAADRYEIRAGLQKINFGSATLLRPLRWFDSVDPRDPLKLTNGVYALLGRYYFLNNANVWAWALHGNKELKGWETVPGSEHGLETGGRFQFPVKNGEMAFSLHQRRAKGASRFYDEQSFGFDTKLDVGVGLWLESSVTRQEDKSQQYPYKSLVCVGSDYTFDVGRGLHVLFEEMVVLLAKHPFTNGDRSLFSGLSVSYPITIFDSVSTVIYYDDSNRQWSRHLSWQRTYDNRQLHVSAFWNPEQKNAASANTEYANFAGKGFQIMLIYNH